MKILTKLKHLLGRRARLARLEEEMRHHFELLVEENEKRGLSPAEARRQAHLVFGNALVTREESEDALGWPSLEAWGQDVRVAWRSLSRRPAFAASIIAILMLGLGVTTAVFSLVRGVVFEPLAVPRPGELQLVVDAKGEPFLLSAPAVRRLAATPEVRGQVAAYSASTRAALRLGEEPTQPSQVQFVSGTFFSALGVTAAHGRALLPTDDEPGAPRPVAVVSHAFWLSKLGGNTDILDRPLRLNHEEVTVVGVAPASFRGVDFGDGPDFWLPLGQQGKLGCSPSAWTISDGPIALEQWTALDNVNWLNVLVRVAPGAAGVPGALERSWRPQLEAAIAIITDPATIQDFRARVPRLVASPQGYSNTRNGFRGVGFTLVMLVSAVVLVTAANTATLLLLRMLGRAKELAVRVALGAGRWRLARSALLEGVLLALGGAAGGALLGGWLTPVLADWLVPGARDELRVFDWSLAGWLALGAVGLGLVMGLAPAWLAARFSPQAVLQQRHLGAGGTLRLGRALIVAQLALSVMLIATAAALALDLQRALAAPPGYDRAKVVQAFFDFRSAGVPVEQQPAVMARLRAAAEAWPQVQRVGFAASGVLSGSRSASGLYFRGEGVRQPRDNVQHESINESYFATMGMLLRRGRAFTVHDTDDRPNVAVISERLAREVFGEADPIGRRFGFGETPDEEDREIVGVVADAQVNGVREAAPAMFYDPLPQWRRPASCLVIRVEGDAAALRDGLKRRLAEVEPGLMLINWVTLEERAERWVRNDRAAVRLTASFGGLATVLAVIGVLGALGYLVASRSREIAVRIAIGASPGRVGLTIVREGILLGALGAGLGLGLALLMPRVLGAWMMTGLKNDALALTVAVVVGVLAALAGAAWPARRATKIDPLTLLKSE
jgi:predicted permease